MTLLLSLLLQMQVGSAPAAGAAAADSSATAANAAANAAAADLSLIDLIVKGGWIMLPLFLLSFVSLYIIYAWYSQPDGER
jgi:biopolymer transport protein ExbB